MLVKAECLTYNKKEVTTVGKRRECVYTQKSAGGKRKRIEE